MSTVQVLIKSFCGYLANYICSSQKAYYWQARLQEPFPVWLTAPIFSSTFMFEHFKPFYCLITQAKLPDSWPTTYIKTVFCASDVLFEIIQHYGERVGGGSK